MDFARRNFQAALAVGAVEFFEGPMSSGGMASVVVVIPVVVIIVRMMP